LLEVYTSELEVVTEQSPELLQDVICFYIINFLYKNMGGTTSSTISANEVNAIISNVMASIQSSNNTVVDQEYLTTQIISDSTNCRNVKITRNKLVYSNDSQIFTSMDAVQSIYVKVLNQLETTNDIDQTGGGSGDTSADTKATIMNILQTNLTQSEIVDYTNSFITNDESLQVCSDSKGGMNLIVGSQKQIYDTYTQQYSQMSSVQQVSADLSNYLSADQSVTRTGILAVFLKAIAVVCIAIIIIVAVFVAVIVLGILK
jgi:hypothetical protein